jgi:hypothetical protein
VAAEAEVIGDVVGHFVGFGGAPVYAVALAGAARRCAAKEEAVEMRLVVLEAGDYCPECWLPCSETMFLVVIFINFASVLAVYRAGLW